VLWIDEGSVQAGLRPAGRLNGMPDEDEVPALLARNARNTLASRTAERPLRRGGRSPPYCGG